MVGKCQLEEMSPVYLQNDGERTGPGEHRSPGASRAGLGPSIGEPRTLPGTAPPPSPAAQQLGTVQPGGQLPCRHTEDVPTATFPGPRQAPLSVRGASRPRAPVH